MEDTKCRKKKKTGLTIVLAVLVVLAAAGFGILGYYLYKQANSGLFFDDTKLNGYNVSGMTVGEVQAVLEKDYSSPQIRLTEQEQDALTLTLEDMGYTINSDELRNSIQDCMDRQRSDLVQLLSSMIQGDIFEVRVPFDFDEKVFQSNVTQSRFTAERVACVNASMEYNGREYYIEPEVYGNEMDDADIQVMVKDRAEKMVASDRPEEDAVLDVPSSFYYLPEVTKEDKDMNQLMNIYNAFCKADITLKFGKTVEKLDWETIQNWIEIQDGEAILLEECVRSYVNDLAASYDTLYYPRDFVTSDGRTVHFESSDYGYRLDVEGEIAQLVQDIYNNTEVKRQPVYSVKGYKRNGRDDICGTYVEANLTKQHLWFYKDGKLVTETDFVSGLPKDDRETMTGVFCIPYKKSPEVLKGDTWEEKVNYWMPFYDGQGLHDASWRTSFGGNIYQTNGSHGCINLPSDQAKIIYKNMEERIAIFIYK